MNTEDNNLTGLIDDFNPLQENVTQRDYTKPKVSGVNVDAAPIEEPVFTAPSFEELEAQMNGGSIGNDAPIDEGPDSANPYLENLDKKDVKNASSALVEAVLDGYSMLNKFGNKLVQFNAEKVQAMMRTGEIDPDLTLPINGRNMGILDYINAYNQETSEVISVDDEFKNKVRPVMLRVFMKRNIGMTDEQLLGYYFGVDILTKGAMVFSLRKQNEALLESLREISQNTKPAPAPKASRVQPQEEFEDNDPEPPIKRSAVKKKEREFVEPEEEIQEEVFEPVVEVETKTAETDVRRGRRPTAGPQFGDPSILSHMEEIANSGTGRKTRTRRKK